ncbi:dihydrofolate reductase family protein [Glycomyces xiaoerkulensis]|uniref:dihydrofolate reductase family protein n=1 Tax=Glycomyces xiaoerkulensis TaxID=2038139 RepID=UPI000C263F19|nr:dihydrofolate reductase family protein [Glycomyces xiaoerkulensis]
MSEQARSLTYYVGASVDGYIAGPDGQFDCFPVEPDVLAAMNEVRPETVPTAFRETIGLADAPNLSYDTVLMGRGTYLPGLEAGHPSPYAHLRQYVFSSTLDPGLTSEVTFVRDDAPTFVRRLKQEAGRGIWLCGGGKLAAALIDEIDQIVVKRYPLVLGGGIPMFDGPYQPSRFDLAENRTFDSGTAIQTYRKA